MLLFIKNALMQCSIDNNQYHQGYIQRKDLLRIKLGISTAGTGNFAVFIKFFRATLPFTLSTLFLHQIALVEQETLTTFCRLE